MVREQDREELGKKNTLKRLVSGTEMKRRLRNINGFILGNEDASTIQLR